MDTQIRCSATWIDLKDLSRLIDEYADEVEALENKLYDAEKRINELETENNELQEKIDDLEGE